MKKLILIGLSMTFCINSWAQWTNPSSGAVLNNTNNGNVGIGAATFTPIQPLSVLSKGGGTNYGSSVADFDFGITDNASTSLQLLGLVNTAGGYGSLQVLKSNGAYKNLVLQGQGGYTGIGDFNPTNGLSIATPQAKTAGLFRIIANGTINSTITEGMLSFGVYSILSGRNTVTGAEYIGAAIMAKATKQWTPGSAQGTAIAFSTTANTTTTVSESMRIDQNGNVGIGTQSPDQRLTVSGTIHAKAVTIDVNVPVPDFVFDRAYKLMPLPDLRRYVDLNKHLPEIPSATEMTEKGMDVSTLNIKLLKKVEELTLYIIEIKEKSEESQKSLKYLLKNNEVQQKRILKLEHQLDKITMHYHK